MPETELPDTKPLPAFKVRSFRAFRDEASIRLRPLTLLYGHNQAGKSTLLRLLPLIANSLLPGTAALDLQSPSLRGGTFKELGWMGRAPALSPWITVVSHNSQPEPTFAIQYADDNGIVVNRVQLSRGITGDTFIVSLDGDVHRTSEQIEALYSGKYRGSDWTGTLTFSRFFPDNLPDRAEEIAQDVQAALEPLARIQWLGANRLADGSAGTRRALCCLPDGSDLASLMRGQERTVLATASQWLSGQEGLADEVTIQTSPSGQPQLVLGAPGRERLPIYLAGEGVRALLPILLCACWADAGRGKADSDAPSMLAVEEPEAHLHPNLQVALFDRLIETVRRGIPVTLETHSVYLLRAMQVAILEGRLSSEDVGLYWVESDTDGAASINPVTIEKDATFKEWRPFEFEQEQELAHQILDLRWQQGKKP